MTSSTHSPMRDDFSDMHWVERALRDALRRNDAGRRRALLRGAAGSARERDAPADALRLARWLIEHAPEQIVLRQAEAEPGAPDALVPELDGAPIRLFDPVELDLAWCATRRRLFALDCADHVLLHFEGLMPGDRRPHEALAAARDFACTGAADDAYEPIRDGLAAITAPEDVGDAEHHAVLAGMRALLAAQDAVGPEGAVLTAALHARESAGLAARRGLVYDGPPAAEIGGRIGRGLFQGMRQLLTRSEGEGDGEGAGRTMIGGVASTIASAFSYFERLTERTRAGEEAERLWQARCLLHHLCSERPTPLPRALSVRHTPDW